MVLLQQQMKRSSGTASQAKLLPNGRVAYGGGVYFSNCKSRVFNFADKHEDPGQSLAATRTILAWIPVWIHRLSTVILVL